MLNSLDEIELRSEEVQEILSSVPIWMVRWGSTLFLSLFLLVLLLACLIKYPDVIESEAILTTEIPPQKEFAMVSAKIDTIYVREAQIVFKNTLLAVLENTANSEDVFYLKSIVDNSKFNYDMISFPIDSIPILFLGEIDQYFSLFENSYYEYQLNKKLQPFSNQAMANEVSLFELRRRLSTLRTQYRLAKSEYDFKKIDLKRHMNLHKKDVISQQELEDKQLEVIISERNFKNVSISISQINEAIGEAKKTSNNTEISRTREETQLLKSVIQSFNQLKNAIRDWENRYVLKSEIQGKVSFLNYWNENQTVQQGDLMFTIIPPDSTSNYIVKVKAPILNSGKIIVGQKVYIKLQSYPEMEFGVLKGLVEGISQTLSKEGHYLVDVSLDEGLITSYGKKIEFKQEMRGRAEIILEELTIFERIFYQFRRIFSKTID